MSGTATFGLEKLLSRLVVDSAPLGAVLIPNNFRAVWPECVRTVWYSRIYLMFLLMLIVWIVIVTTIYTGAQKHVSDYL